MRAKSEWVSFRRQWRRLFVILILILAILLPPFYIFAPGFSTVLPLWRAIVGGAFYPVLIIAFIYLNLLCPRYVFVRRKWIQLSWGQSHLRIPRERIVHLELRDDDEFGHRLHLKLRTSKGKEFDRDAAVRDTVDLDALRGLIRDLNG